MNLQQYWVAMEPEQVGQFTLQNVLFLLQKYKTEGLDNTFIIYSLAIWNLTQRETKRIPSMGPLASICNNLIYPLAVNSQNYVLWTWGRNNSCWMSLYEWCDTSTYSDEKRTEPCILSMCQYFRLKLKKIMGRYVAVSGRFMEVLRKHKLWK